MTPVKIQTVQDRFYIYSALELSRIACTKEDGPREACVIGAVVCSVSFLECTINGLYEDASHLRKRTKFHDSIATVWSVEFDRQPVLAKYQLALVLARRESFKTGAEPYQSADALITLRNAIAHPKEIIASEKQQEKLEKTLRGKYSFSKLTDSSRDFFSYHCLSPECAAWSVKAAAGFALEFYKRLPPTAYLFPPANSLRTIFETAKNLS